MGLFDITQETDVVVPSVFQTANSLATAPGGAKTTIDWTSGYFSVQEGYKERVLDSRATVRIVTASPEVRFVPHFRRWGSLTLAVRRQTAFSDLVASPSTSLRRTPTSRSSSTTKPSREQSDEDGIRTSSCENGSVLAGPTTPKVRSPLPSRTFFASLTPPSNPGIWLTPSLTSTLRVPLTGSPLADPHENDDENKLQYPSTPFLTLIGSSNYGRRSAERDLEANVLVTTFSPELRKDLQEEIVQIRSWATDVVDDKLFARKERRVGWGVRKAADAIKDKL